MAGKINFRAVQRPSEDPKVPRRPAHEVIGQIGGGSPYGSTTYKRARLCPYEDGLVRIAKLRPTRNKEELDVGWITHACREAYYFSIKAHQDALGEPPAQNDTLAWEHYFWGGLPAAERAALEIADAYRDEPGYLHTWETVSRTISGYMDHWRKMDLWRVLAVEETLIYEEPIDPPLELRVTKQGEEQANIALDFFGYSCRLDLVIRSYEPQTRGIWLDEFKTCRWISSDLLDGYQLDQQILGQDWLFRQCVDIEAYNAPFKGVIIDIVSRQMNPKCERVYVGASPYHRDAFERSIRQWALTNRFYEMLEYPRALGSCASALRGYSRCAYYDLCHGRPEMSVKDWANEPPPVGFYREERMLEDPSEYQDPSDFEDYA